MVACKTAFLLNMSSFKDVFQGFCGLQGFFTLFRDWANTYLAEYLLMTVSTCSWFININTGLFFEKQKSLRRNEKANSSNR